MSGDTPQNAFQHCLQHNALKKAQKSLSRRVLDNSNESKKTLVRSAYVAEVRRRVGAGDVAQLRSHIAAALCADKRSGYAKVLLPSRAAWSHCTRAKKAAMFGLGFQHRPKTWRRSEVYSVVSAFKVRTVCAALRSDQKKFKRITVVPTRVKERKFARGEKRYVTRL